MYRQGLFYDFCKCISCIDVVLGRHIDCGWHDHPLIISRPGGYHYQPCMVFAPLRQNVIRCINHQLTMYQHCLFITNVNGKKAIRYLLEDQRFDTIVCSLTRRKASSCPLQTYNNRTRGKLISNNTESLNNIVVFQFQKQLLVLYFSSLNNLY